MKKQWIEIILFKFSWALALWAAIENRPEVSLGFALSILLGQLAFSSKKKTDLIKITTVLLLGGLFECVNRYLGFYDFLPSQQVPPLWLLAFWPTLAILFFSFVELLYTKSNLIQWSLGFTGGLGYFAGEWVNKMVFTEPKLISLLLFSFLWGSGICSLGRSL